MSGSFKIYVSGNAPVLYPCDTYFGIMRYDTPGAIEIPEFHPYQAEWGEIITTTVLLEKQHMPQMLDMVYLSIAERQFYSIEAPLPTAQMESLWQTTRHDTGDPLFTHIVVGMAPYGQVAVWLRGADKSTLLTWVTGEKITISASQFSEFNPRLTIDDICNYYINNDERVKANLLASGLPPRHLFDKRMQQYCYRYLPMFQQWDEDSGQWTRLAPDSDTPLPQLDYIEEALWDGTHDKLHDERLMNYHEAGKPMKLALKWHVGKNEYSTFVWMDQQLMSAAFDRFYGNHRDTKVDFIIRIDPYKKKYQLALYRYGLQEPVAISEQAYQMIVFKDQFEHYRSGNYDQPRGAWIW